MLAEGAGHTAGWRPLTCPDLPPHQELWAVDRLQVQEFMLSFLRDPLREIEETYFFLDEVSPASHSLSQNQGAGGLAGAPLGPSHCPLCPHLD